MNKSIKTLIFVIATISSTYGYNYQAPLSAVDSNGDITYAGYVDYPQPYTVTYYHDYNPCVEYCGYGPQGEYGPSAAYTLTCKKSPFNSVRYTNIDYGLLNKYGPPTANAVATERSSYNSIRYTNIDYGLPNKDGKSTAIADTSAKSPRKSVRITNDDKGLSTVDERSRPTSAISTSYAVTSDENSGKSQTKLVQYTDLGYGSQYNYGASDFPFIYFGGLPVSFFMPERDPSIEQFLYS